MKIPNDKSKCTGNGCIKKEQCLRYVGQHENHEQSSIFSPNSCKRAVIDGDEIKGWVYKMFIEVSE